MRQFPKVAVLGCSASRVPIEMVFDQDLGGIFAIRVAGGLLDMTTKASLENAVHHLKVKVVVVMCHEFCGAVKAARVVSTTIASTWCTTGVRETESPWSPTSGAKLKS